MPKHQLDIQRIFDESETTSDDDRAYAEAPLTGPKPVRPPHGSPDAWLEEVERRAHAAVAGSPGLPWEVVHARIRTRLDSIERAL